MEYFTLMRFIPYCCSTLYLLVIESMADLVPLCKVSFEVVFDLSIPIPNQSARTSTDILVYLSVEE